MRQTVIILLILPFLACSGAQPAPDSLLTLHGDTMTVGCQVIEKAFISKRGDATKHMELYLQCSVQDYYIKFCESKVTRKQIEKFIDQGITAKMVLIDGEWDICPGDPVMQSRVGTYAAILEIQD